MNCKIVFVLLCIINISLVNTLYSYTINQSWYDYEKEFFPEDSSPEELAAETITVPGNTHKSSRDFMYIIPFSIGTFAASTLVENPVIKATMQKMAFILPVARLLSTTRIWMWMITHIPLLGKQVRCSQVYTHTVDDKLIEDHHMICNACKIKHVFRELPIIMFLMYCFDLL